MGILRYFLALVVVLGHASYTTSLKPLNGNGALAVQAFFVISGFYMSLIIKKYQLSSRQPGVLRTFYLSRALRIYPIYFLCLLITVAFYYFNILVPTHAPREVLHSLHHFSDKFIYLFSNLFIFGQGVMRFLIYNPATHAFVLHPVNDDVNIQLWGSGYPLLGQAWTLSLELTFYLWVPFLLTQRIRLIAMICVLAFCLRGIISYEGFTNNNIEHAFFPTALGIFLLGSLAHRIIYPATQPMQAITLKYTAWAVLIVMMIYSMVIYDRLPENIAFWIFVISIAITTPFLFAHFKNSTLDSYIGELSYPVYMSHYFCLELMVKYFNPAYSGYYAAITATVVSAIMIVTVIKPIDNFRHAKAFNHNNNYSTNALALRLT